MAFRKKKISKLRTGGQSGVDRAVMDFAKENGIPLCGWCPYQCDASITNSSRKVLASTAPQHARKLSETLHALSL